jgi:PPM family protein phosphatase
MRTTASTHIGRRKSNQDRYLVMDLDNRGALLAVADGMGGHAGGEEAASSVIEELRSATDLMDDPLISMAKAIRHSGERIMELGAARPELDGLGSTLTAVVLLDGSIYWAHVGDSRLYLFHDSTLDQITVDQTLVQGLLDEGVITAEEARSHPLRHMLDQCVGCPECEPVLGRMEVQAGDTLLLSTDGLHEAMAPGEIVGILRGAGELQDMASELIRKAFERGSGDNITVVLARVG